MNFKDIKIEYVIEYIIFLSYIEHLNEYFVITTGFNGTVHVVTITCSYIMETSSQNVKVKQETDDFEN